jgi:tetratricopeptide (TPR) repeat protein
MSTGAMNTGAIDLDAFNLVRAKLESLVDDDPAKAIEEARALSADKSIGGTFFTSLKACILIDAGSRAKNKPAIEEGITLFKKLLAKSPKQADLHYNLGNGLLALADLEPYAGYEWYLTTAEARREGRSSLQRAISGNNSLQLRSIALTNLGNALWKAQRWAEAYDAYARALAQDGSNAMASTGAAKVLLRCIARGIGDKQVLQSVAARHLETAKLHWGRIAELAGTRAPQQLSKLLQKRLEAGTPPDLRRASAYEKFVAAHRLALSPTIDGQDCSLKRWDSLRFDSITEQAGKDSGVPALFAMLNVMKSDFLAARYLAHQALSGTFPESGLYSDTLDYAIYGVAQSMLSLAQRACIDVLDKVAVATTDYFAIPGSPRTVYFANRWFADSQRGQPLSWHASLRPHIDKGNTAIIALTEISLDVGEGGALHRKKSLRHSSTHRFTVLHDLGCNPSRESVHVEHCEISDFKTHLIESLQLARAAVLYFVEMVSIAESSNASSPGKTVPINVPTHHRIRGEDDTKPRTQRTVHKPTFRNAKKST